MTRTLRARARRRCRRRRWVLSSIKVEQAWRRYLASGDGHRCVRLCPCATDPTAACDFASDFDRHRSHWPWPYCNPSCGVPYPVGGTL